MIKAVSDDIPESTKELVEFLDEIKNEVLEKHYTGVILCFNSRDGSTQVLSHRSNRVFSVFALEAMKATLIHA